MGRKHVATCRWRAFTPLPPLFPAGTQSSSSAACVAHHLRLRAFAAAGDDSRRRRLRRRGELRRQLSGVELLPHQQTALEWMIRRESGTTAASAATGQDALGVEGSEGSEGTAGLWKQQRVAELAAVRGGILAHEMGLMVAMGGAPVVGAPAFAW